ncbi:MAG: outer membrane protein transport protein [Rhodocyclaceae bacterium]|nr:outer membrane protein transport protein [Rhodocyclaceae bacterium]
MKKTMIARALPFALVTLASGQAAASGFQLLEQNASGLGNAYAGSAAVADNASTIFFNPAGMTQLQAREVSAGINAIRPTYKFTDQGSSVGALAGTGTGNDAGAWAFVPNAYLSWALDKDLYVGVGISVPFGLVTEYDKPWLGAAQAVKFDIKTININPSIAYRVNEKVSLGFGLNWQRMEAEYTRVAAVSNAATTGTNVTLDASDDSMGWNIGALFTLSERTTLGISYRSKMKHTLTGDIRVDGTLAGFNAALTTGAAKADVELPDTVIFSVAQQLNDRWEMLGDVSWTGWSSIQKIHIVRTSGTLINQTVQTLDADFRDTWRIALGANYKLDDAWKLKFGVAYDQTPVTGPGTRLVSLPDSNRTWLTAGAQWQVSPASTVDMGVAYLHVPETTINNNQAASGRGTVTGTYDARVWILGAQYSMAF